MSRRLIFLVMIAMGAAGAAQPVTASPPADAASELVGVHAKLVQLRNELQTNQAALANKGLSADSQAKLNARAQQISSEINALLAQEKKLSTK